MKTFLLVLSFVVWNTGVFYIMSAVYEASGV
jgi:hypothetical protein